MLARDARSRVRWLLSAKPVANAISLIGKDSSQRSLRALSNLRDITPVSNASELRDYRQMLVAIRDRVAELKQQG